MDQSFKPFQNERNSVGRVIKSEQRLNEPTFRTEVDTNPKSYKKSKIATEIQKQKNRRLIRQRMSIFNKYENDYQVVGDQKHSVLRNQVMSTVSTQCDLQRYNVSYDQKDWKDNKCTTKQKYFKKQEEIIHQYHNKLKQKNSFKDQDFHFKTSYRDQHQQMFKYTLDKYYVEHKDMDFINNPGLFLNSLLPKQVEYMPWVIRKGYYDPSVFDRFQKHINVVDFGLLTDRKQFQQKDQAADLNLSFYKKDADIDELIKLNLKHINQEKDQIKEKERLDLINKNQISDKNQPHFDKKSLQNLFKTNMYLLHIYLLLSFHRQQYEFGGI